MSVSHAGVEPLRFAVGDARRHVAIADQHRAFVRASGSMSGLPLVAVGDVEQLHHVGAVVALAVQRARRSPRRSPSRSRGTTAGGTRGRARSADRAAARPASACRSDRALRRRSGVLSFARTSASDGPRHRRRPSEDPRIPARPLQLSSASRSSIVWRRRITGHRAVLDQHFGRHRPAVVVRRHDGAVGAGVEHGHAGRRPPAAAGADPCRACRCSRRAVRRCRRGSPGAPVAAAPARCDGRRRRASAASARSCRRRGSRTRLPPGRSLTSTTRDSSTPAGRDDVAARLEHDRPARTPGPPAAAPPRSRRASAPASRRTRCRGRRRGRGARWRSRRRAARARASTSASAARRSGSRSVICEPTCACRPTISSAVAAAARAADVARRRRAATPNLLVLRPGRDVRMAARVDVRVDAQRDAGARLPLARERVDALELAFRLDVDRLDAEVDRLRRAPPRVLPTPVKTICGGDEAGAQRDVDLAAGVRVGAAAEARAAGGRSPASSSP